MKRLKRANKIFKTALFMTSFGIITTNAFCGGTINGTIDTPLLKDKGDTVVYLIGVKRPVVPQHKSVYQQNLRIVPKVITIPVGSTIDITNNDNVYSTLNSTSPAKVFSLKLFEPGTTRSIAFDKPGAVHLHCNVHSEMSVWIIITDNQYAAVTGQEGRFTIPNVPAGTYEIATWNEKLKQIGKKTVTVAEGKIATTVIKLAQ